MTSKTSRGESFVIDFNQCGNTEQENIQENIQDKYPRKMPEKTQDKNLQDAFQKFKDKKQKAIRNASRKRRDVPNEARLRAMADPDRMWDLRMRFVEQAKKYFGVPYAKRYWNPDEPQYNSRIFLDCCALVRRCMRDLKKSFGFKLGGWNQSYQHDTLPIVIDNEEDMKPGDLVFISAIYYKQSMKKQRHNLTHVEIWLGDGPKTIGSRWHRGQVQVFDSYRFKATSYHSEKYIFKSIDTWLMGICRSHCPIHTWQMRTETYKPEKKSIFKPTEKPKKKRSTKGKTKRKGQTGAKKSQRDGQQDEMKDTQEGTSSEDSETDDDNVMAYHALKEVEGSPDVVPERVPLVQSPNTVVIRAKELEEEDAMKKEVNANQEGIPLTDRPRDTAGAVIPDGDARDGGQVEVYDSSDTDDQDYSEDDSDDSDTDSDSGEESEDGDDGAEEEGAGSTRKGQDEKTTRHRKSNQTGREKHGAAAQNQQERSVDALKPIKNDRGGASSRRGSSETPRPTTQPTTLEEKLRELQIIGAHNNTAPPLVQQSPSSSKKGRRLSSSSAWVSRGPSMEQKTVSSFLTVQGSSMPLRPINSVPQMMARQTMTTVPAGLMKSTKFGRVASAPASFQDVVGVPHPTLDPMSEAPPGPSDVKFDLGTTKDYNSGKGTH